MVKPVVTAIDMGYGHLRPAAALADHLATEVVQMDAPPFGTRRDRAFWTGIRKFYEPLTRMSQVGICAGLMRALLNTLTAIPPPLPERDLSGPTQGTRWMCGAARVGVGRALARYLRESGAPLLATFYAAAVLAEMHGAESTASGRLRIRSAPGSSISRRPTRRAGGWNPTECRARASASRGIHSQASSSAGTGLR